MARLAIARTAGSVLASVVLVLAAAGPVAATRGQPLLTVPISGVGSGVDAYEPPAAGCPAGAVWRYHSVGTGEFSHLGAVTMAVTHCTVLDSPTTGHTVQGTITLTAANGDTLNLAHQATFEVQMPSPGRLLSLVDLEWTITGGTGRFAGAAGAGEGSGFSDIDAVTNASTTTMTFSGAIAYDASNRANH